jgi:nitronate monooxygenase
MSLLDRLGISAPVVGAGLGGGLSASPLTIAIGRAGGMGQIGILPPDLLRAQMDAHREAGDAGPLAVNLLLPFARRAHWEAARTADAVVTFWGVPRRHTDRVWIHQCGSVEEAMAAADAGADGVIVQGVEAGGHVRGTTPALRLTEQVRAALGPRYPVWMAGGVTDRAGVEAALAAGVEAVVVGTRFLMSEESSAHPAYKQRLIEAKETVMTELFGAGWPAPHRVIRNAATQRWLRDDPRGPARVRFLHRPAAVPGAGQPHPAGGTHPTSRHAATRPGGSDRQRSALIAGRRAAVCGPVHLAHPRHPPRGRDSRRTGGQLTVSWPVSAAASPSRRCRCASCRPW